jgi:thiol-disulfide isomerase/thioredoxin
MNRRTVLLAALLLPAGAGGIAACESRTASAACPATECLPSLSFKDINHEAYAPEALKGKVVVVNFWATWCPPCNKEIPAFNKVYARYKDKGVVMFGMLSDNTVDDTGLLNFMSDHEFTYPVVRADQNILQAYEYPPALPATFVYDRAGKLVTSHRGAMSEDELSSLLDRLLK